jgi:ribonuclease H2 subunit A
MFSQLTVLLLLRSKVNLNEISHNSAMGLVKKLLDMGVLLAEVRTFVPA